MQGNNADEILPGLWLGNYKAAADIQWLGENGISCVFNCTKNLPFVPSINNKFRVPVDDNLQADEIRNLELWSYEIVFKIKREYQTGRPMLVHCHAGMQRSAACVAMFLIATRNMNPQQAIDFIRDIRPIAFRPSANFLPAIEGFHHTFQRDFVPKISLASSFY